MLQRISLKLKLLWNELHGMLTKKLLWLELVFTQKAIKPLQNERAELLMLMCGRSREGERWYERMSDKHPSQSTHYPLPFYNHDFFFLVCNIYFTLNVYGPAKSTPAHLRGLEPLSFLDNNRGESFEAGVKWVLNSRCSSSIALIRFVILRAKEINTSWQIFLMLTIKTRPLPPPNQNVWAESRLFTNQPKCPQGYPCESCIIYCLLPIGKKDGLQ